MLRTFVPAHRRTSFSFALRRAIPSFLSLSRELILRPCIRFRSWRWSIKPKKPASHPDGVRNVRARLQQGLGLCAVAALVLIAGCRQDMQDEPKFVPQRGTAFFPDGRSVRDQVMHTVARGQEGEADFFHTGLQNGKEV